jgi:hypothetical protein
MKVIKNNDESVEFDNGLKLSCDHSRDCCEHNYLDFEQLTVGRDFKTMNAAQFVGAITLKDDGFFIKDKMSIPVWVQARSRQNGYYGNGVDLVVTDDKQTLRPRRAGGKSYDELFNGDISEDY